MADRDDLDFFMEHAILSKDLRDLAARARAIRARERRLAELAHEMGTILTNVHYEMGDHFDREINPDLADWLRRYEEAVK